MVKVAIETKNLSASLRDFRRFWGITQEEALKTQGRLLAVKLVQFTPPRSLNQGEAAVRRDFKRLFAPGYKGKDGGVFFYHEGERYSLPRNQKGRATARHTITGGGHTFKGAFNNVHLGERQIQDLHNRFRNSRGKVANIKDKSAVDPDRLENVKERSLWNVGEAKGGWMAGVLAWPVKARYAGGRATVDKRLWIMKHKDKGTAVYRHHKHFPSIELINRSQWAKRSSEAARLTVNAMRSQAKNITKSLAKAAGDAIQRARLSRGIHRISTAD